MKVLHLIRKNSQLKASFILNQIQNHIKYKPFVAYFEERSKAFDGGFSNAEDSDFEVFNLDSKPSLFSKLRYKILKEISPRAKRKLLELIQNQQPEIIHLHYGTDAGLYLPVISKLGIPTVVSFYGYECSGFPGVFFGLGKLFLRFLVFRHATYVLAMSEDMRQDLIAIGCPDEKIKVHYYGTDVMHFHNEIKSKSSELIKFLIISGFAPQKGHKYLIEAFALAYAQNNKIRLTIVGAGPIEAEINGWVEATSLSSVIDLPGPVVYGSEAHLNYFRNHEVFIHPSVTDFNGDKEGIPGALVEAMAAGLPVISTFHAGIPYVLENGTEGLLVAERDVDGLKSKILELADDKALRLRLAEAGQKRALSDLDLKKNEKNLERIYGLAASL